MAFLRIVDAKRKLSFIKRSLGMELLTLWDKEVRIQWEDVGGGKKTYKEVIQTWKDTLLVVINRDRAVIDLLKIEQNERSLTDFLTEVVDPAELCQANENQITEDDLVRMALIAGFRDKALAEKYTLA